MDELASKEPIGHLDGGKTFRAFSPDVFAGKDLVTMHAAG